MKLNMVQIWLAVLLVPFVLCIHPSALYVEDGLFSMGITDVYFEDRDMHISIEIQNQTGGIVGDEDVQLIATTTMDSYIYTFSTSESLFHFESGNYRLVLPESAGKLTSIAVSSLTLTNDALEPMTMEHIVIYDETSGTTSASVDFLNGRVMQFQNKSIEAVIEENMESAPTTTSNQNNDWIQDSSVQSLLWDIGLVVALWIGVILVVHRRRRKKKYMERLHHHLLANQTNRQQADIFDNFL